MKPVPISPQKVKSFMSDSMIAKSARNEDEALAHYRRVRDEIKQFVNNLENYTRST